MAIKRKAFRSLSARLTVQFALLFAAAMLCVSAALSTFIAGAASRQVESQLQSSGAVYDRLWQQRVRELQGGAQLLARDFGFRAAVATGDTATMQSALTNATARLRVKTAFIVSLDGSVKGVANRRLRSEAEALWDPLDAGRLGGVAVLGGAPRQLVAAPVMAPSLIGWVVFAADLDAREMRSLERLSAIPLHAGVLVREDGDWRSAAGTMRVDAAAAKSLERHSKASSAFEMNVDNEPSITLAKPLPTLLPANRALLILAYPKSEALGAARKLQWALGLMTLLGLSLAAFATWRAAGRITEPLARLDHAASRLATGEHVKVQVRGEDELARLAATFNEMSDKIEEREKRITQLAFNDVLTGLPNRTMFQQQLEHVYRSIEGRDALVALHCLDLDQFKVINDTLGHPAGDALLIAAGQRIRDVARGHFVARLGGDEFVVLQSVGNDRNAIDRLAEDLITAIARPLVIDGNELVPSTSVGIAIAPFDAPDGGTLLRNADLALYRAKEAGRGTFAFFEESLNRRAQDRRRIETDLRLALERGEFELFYQPLFDLTSNRIGSFEALIRWNHPERGLVSPLDFIGVAEETGIIVPMGAWALREACRQAAQWPDDVRVAVNVSPIQFHRGGLHETIVQALAASGLAPARLEVEITESVFLDGGESTLKLLHSLRALGVRVALDDFGTGYSSLSYLQSFPFDKIKIDRSFIDNLLTRPGASAIVAAITELARALGMETTAEGVEDNAQLTELRSHGCSSVQGFLFAKPMRAGEVDHLFVDEMRGRDVA
ncbi:MAG TPA: EAL domain-containing protein [Sphingomicrobium sp.]